MGDSKNSKIRDFINFKIMIAPGIIGGIYWVSAIACIIIGIIYIQEGKDFRIVLALVFSALVVLRVVCENLIVLFSIQATMLEVRNLLKSQQDRENQTNLHADNDR